MTPAEHYAEAERLVARFGDPAKASFSIDALAAAQVHATLATVDPNRVWPLRQVPLQPKGSTGKVRMEGAD